MTNSDEQQAFLEEALQEFTQLHGINPEALVQAKGSEPDWLLAVKLAASAWLVDDEIFTKVIRPRLSEPRPDFASLTHRPELEPVPRMPGTWCVRPELAANQELPDHPLAFFEELAALWRHRITAAQTNVDPAVEMHFLARARSEVGWQLFEKLFAEAESRFDLDRCQQLLNLARPLDPASWAKSTLPSTNAPTDAWTGLERYHQRHAARMLFAADWYKTGRYYRRSALHKTLTAHIQSRKSPWLQPLFASGGVGKTMLLRAWATRDLIPHDVAVGRIDFDFVGWHYLESSPWLILLPLAEQLARQVERWTASVSERPAPPFSRFFELRDSWNRWLKPQTPDQISGSQQPLGAQTDPDQRGRRCQHYAADFAESLPHNRTVVLIFDTTEEPYLRSGDPYATTEPTGFPRGPLPAVLQMLQAVCALRPGVRVIFSGRYDLFARRAADDLERIPGLPAAFGSVRKPSLEVRGFSQEETDSYLRECCALDLPADVRAAIFDKARMFRKSDATSANPGVVEPPAALPFDVAFWAREAARDTRLDKEKIHQAPGLHFAIERVIRRIPRADVQWLVRYAVVPRRLTHEFFTNVLLEPLRRAVRGDAGNLDRAKQTLDTQHPQWKQEALWAVGAPAPEAIDELWNVLSAYASGPEEGWLEVGGTTIETAQLRFHPRVVEPLRHLLEMETVWSELHRSAKDYFLHRAASAGATGNTANWATNAAEALFHAFQESPSVGERTWAELSLIARALPGRVRRTLALMVLGEAGFEPGEEPCPRSDVHGQRRVSPVLEREAALEAARACLWIAVFALKFADQQKFRIEAERHLAHVRRLPGPPPDVMDYNLVRLSEVSYQLGFIQSSLTDLGGSWPLFSQGLSMDRPIFDGDSALLTLAQGRIAQAAATPSAWQHFDRVAQWASKAGGGELPRSAAAAMAALTAGGDGQLVHADGHWDSLVNWGPAAWSQAAEWLGIQVEELQLNAAYHFADCGRLETAAALGEALARSVNPRIQLLARLLAQQAAHRAGGTGEPWEIFAQFESMTSTGANGPQTGDPEIDGHIASVHALALVRQRDFIRASELFDGARRRWKEGGHHDLAHGAAISQALSMLVCGHLREARTALATIPKERPTAVRLAFPWPVSLITAELILSHLRGEKVESNVDTKRFHLPASVLGRRGPPVQAELEAALLAIAPPTDEAIKKLLKLLWELPNAATRASSLWPFGLWRAKPLELGAASGWAPSAVNEIDGKKPDQVAPSRVEWVELKSLFPWLAKPMAVSDNDLLPLLSLGGFLNFLGFEKEARSLVRQVLTRAGKLQRPWLWREATQLAAQLNLNVRAVPPLPDDRTHPLWNSPLAPALLLEAAQRSLRRGDRAAARRSLARARQAPSFGQLRQPPHLAFLREFDAELAVQDGNTNEAIHCLEEAAAAWRDMENEPRAALCQQKAIQLQATEEPNPSPQTSGTPPPNTEKWRTPLGALLLRPPPLLKIERPAPSGVLRALFQLSGRQLEFLPLAGELPEALGAEGPGALSELHFQLHAKNSGFFAALQNVLVEASELASPSSELFLRFYSAHPLVMALPWEAMAVPNRPSPLLCRRSQPDWPPGRLLRWLQSALNRHGAKLALDGQPGPFTETALTNFWGNRPLPESAAEIFQQLGKELPGSAAPGRIAVVADDRDSPYSQALVEAYQLAPSSGETAGQPRRPRRTDLDSAAAADLIHLCGTITEGGESGETTLFTGRHHLTTTSLARFFDRGPHRARPVAILDAILLPGADPREYERHLLRRNLFAHALYGTGQVLAVIATATLRATPIEPEFLAQLAGYAVGGGSLRQAILHYHKSERSSSPFGGPTTALWAPHPDLPFLP